MSKRTLLPESERVYSAAVGKAQLMSTHQILNWIDGVGSEMAATVQDYRRSGDHDQALELRRAAAQILALTEELVVQSENR
jgi:hypothetical protein